MSVYLDRYVMICCPVPKALWQKPNPSCPEYTTLIEGFSEEMDERGLMINDPATPGQVGLLYDGMNGDYCWFGVVVGWERDQWFAAKDTFQAPPITGNDINTAAELLVTAYEKLMKLPFETSWPRLRIIRHYH